MLTTAVMLVSIVQPLAEGYLAELWKASPTSATQAGYHGEKVDEKLDDVSAAERTRRIAWLKKFRTQLETLRAQVRSAHAFEDQADEALLSAAVTLELDELEQIRSFERRCDTPLDGLGSVFFFMAARDYAPLDQRAADVTSRLKQVPRYLDQVRASLTTYVPVYAEAAKDDGDGLVDYLEHDLLELLAKAKDQAALKAAVKDAVTAVRGYLKFVAEELPKKPKGDYRLGTQKYGLRFAPYLQTDQTPAQVLAAAQVRMKAIHGEMAALAKKIVPSGNVKEALDKVAADHPTPETLVPTVEKQLEDARRFVREKNLLALPTHDNLKVTPTPAFMRSQLGVAAFDGAPPLQPSLGAFYYVTPFPKDWPKAKIDSKLREYNRFMLDLLTIHEAMPGHYVQFEHANTVQPAWRRTLRFLLSAGSYVEGWAVYTQDLLVEAGYRDRDPRLALQARKLELRAVINAILDIQLHTNGLTDDAALKLMIDDGFQERTEAELKLRRAKLSVTQLCSYFVGGEAWKAIRAEAERRAGGKLDLRKFHDKALDEGPVTLPTLRLLLSTR